jgi:hypothetical protein
MKFGHLLRLPSFVALVPLQEIGCATLFATHFHELTLLKGDVGVKNLHVGTTIDQQSGSLTMLYQVRAEGFGVYFQGPSFQFLWALWAPSLSRRQAGLPCCLECGLLALGCICVSSVLLDTVSTAGNLQ